MLERNPEWLLKEININNNIKKALNYNATASLMPFTGVFANSPKYQATLEYAHEHGVFDSDADAFSLLTDCSPGVVAPVGDCVINRQLQGLPEDPSYDSKLVREIIRFIRNFCGFSMQHKVRVPLESSNGWPNFEHGNEKFQRYLEVLNDYNSGKFHPSMRDNPIVVVGTRAHPPTFNLEKKEWKWRSGDSPDGRFKYSPKLKKHYNSIRFKMSIPKAQRRNRVVNGHSGHTYAVEKVAVTLIKNILKLPIFVSLEEERLNKLLLHSQAKECFKTDIKQFDSTIPEKVVRDILEALFGDTDLNIDAYLRAFKSTQVFKKNMQEKDTYWVTKPGLWQGNSSGVEGTTIINCMAAFIFCGVLPIINALKLTNITEILDIVIKLILQIPTYGLALNILGDDFLALHTPNNDSKSRDYYIILKKAINEGSAVFASQVEDPKKAGLFIRLENNILVGRPSASSFLLNRLIPEKNANSIFRIGHAYPGLLLVPEIFKNSMGFEKNLFVLKACIKRATGVSFDSYIALHKQKYLDYVGQDKIDEHDLLFLKYLQDPQRILWDEAMEELYDRYNITTASMIPESLVETTAKRIFGDIRTRYTHHSASTLQSLLGEYNLNIQFISSGVLDDRKPWKMLDIYKYSLAKGYEND